jgi:hypothetical protein
MNKEKIKAVFVTDANGEPEYIESGGVKHFKIQLQMEGTPKDAYAVTYELHKSYYDAIRENHDRDEGFREDLTSYGNYDIKVKVRSRQGTSMLITSLVDALLAGHADNRTKAVEQAIAMIDDK